MKEYTLVQYAGYTLTGNPNIYTSDDEGSYSHNIVIDRLPNARSAGSTVVDSEVSDKSISLDSTIITDEYRTSLEVFNELNRVLEEKGRYLRFVQEWEDVTSIASTTGWSFESDAGVRVPELSQSKRVFDNGLSVQVDAGGDFVDLITETGTGANLSTKEGTGNFEFFLYISDVNGFGYVLLDIGGAETDYLEYTFTEQGDGKPVQNGWNWFSIPAAQMTEVGTPDWGNMGVFQYLYVGYDSPVVNDIEIVYGGAIWQNDDNTKNYVAHPSGVLSESNRGITSFKRCTLNFLANKGISETTVADIVYNADALTGAVNSFSVDLEGSYTPLPRLVIEFNTVTGMGTDITITNNTTGDSVVLSQTWAANDVVVVDFSANTVTKNGTQIGYNYVLPRFVLGVNTVTVTLSASSPNVQSQTTNNADLKGEV